MSDQEPYDPLEKIALLSPSSIDLRHIPGDYQKLTPQDIAALLSKVSKGASLLARAKYAQMNVYEDLERWLLVIVSPQPIHHPGMLRTMVKLALIEVVHPRTCPWCKGAKWLPVALTEGGSVINEAKGKHYDCGPCRGTGSVSFTQRKRSEACSIPWTSWRNRWSGVYDIVLGTVNGWEKELRKAVGPPPSH